MAGEDQEVQGQEEGGEEVAAEDGTAATQELIQDLQQSKENMVDGKGDAPAAPTPAKKGKKAAAKKAPAKARASRRKVVESEDDDDVEEEEEEPKPRSRRARRPLAAAN